jgi:hypothetical protein
MPICHGGVLFQYKGNILKSMVFEVFMAVRMLMLFFCVLAPCRLISRCQCFSKMSPSTDKSTQRQNPEEQLHHLKAIHKIQNILKIHHKPVS